MMGEVAYEDGSGVRVVIGVDTHKDEHVAVAIDGQGVRLGNIASLRPPVGMRTSNGGPAAWERSMPSGSKARVPTVSGSHVS